MSLPNSTVPRPSEVFDRVYTSGLWHTQPYNSGSGSDPNGVGKPYCEIMPAILRLLASRRIVDIGCGDGRILAALATELPECQWTGIDCVPALIPRLKKAMPHHSWLHNELQTLADYKNLPRADTFLIKDVMHHWPSQTVLTFIRAIKKTRSPCHLVMTNDNRQGEKTDCELGGYRALDGRLWPLAEFHPRLLASFLHKSIYLLSF